MLLLIWLLSGALSPLIDPAVFQGKEGLLQTERNGQVYYVIHAHQPIRFADESAAKRQKKLQLRAKKILAQHLQNKHQQKKLHFQMSGFQVLRYWEQEKRAHVLAAVPVNQIKIIQTPVKAAAKQKAKPVPSEQTAQAEVQRPIQTQPQKNSLQHLQAQYQRALMQGNTKEADRLFQAIQNYALDHTPP